VPHKLDKNIIEKKMAIAGEIGLYYYMYYTTLFMWGVEYLGWEIFMMAAMLAPKTFEEEFFNIAFEESLNAIELLSNIDIPYVFVHDDLADKNGPIFPPDWYDKYIFPRYEELWRKIKSKGKKIIFVADGNMEYFLKPLKELGIDGVMFENPATNFDKILDVFGVDIVICGMDTYLLTFGTPKDISSHVDLICKKTEGLIGFAICSPGGIHNKIPIENLIAYFDARVRNGFTHGNWQKGEINAAKKLV